MLANKTQRTQKQPFQARGPSGGWSWRPGSPSAWPATSPLLSGPAACCAGSSCPQQAAGGAGVVQLRDITPSHSRERPQSIVLATCMSLWPKGASGSRCCGCGAASRGHGSPHALWYGLRPMTGDHTHQVHGIEAALHTLHLRQLLEVHILHIPLKRKEPGRLDCPPVVLGCGATRVRAT